MAFYPVSLEIEDKPCVVVGGGRVAERKVHGLLACGARLRVVSPELTEGLASLVKGGRIAWLERGYQEGDLDGAFLVIAATDDRDVQLRVHREAVDRKIWLNVADVPELCSFILPATVRQGDLTISISTGGKSPALARHLRIDLEKSFGEEYKLLVDILGILRPAVLAAGGTHAENEILFNRLFGEEVLSWIRHRQWEKLKEYLRTVLGEEVPADCLRDLPIP